MDKPGIATRQIQDGRLGMRIVWEIHRRCHVDEDVLTPVPRLCDDIGVSRRSKIRLVWGRGSASVEVQGPTKYIDPAQLQH